MKTIKDNRIMTGPAAIAAVLFCLAFFAATPAVAQETPPLPAPLQTLADEGAQIRYLGRDGGMDGWVTIQGGQEQYFYVTPDRETMIMGMMFDKTGKMVTLRQLRALQEKSGALDSLKVDLPEDSMVENNVESPEFKTPSEQLYGDVATANWIALGREAAPALYTFIDPQCPHCHAFIDEMRVKYIDAGLVQLRIIPVGFRPETLAQAALLLAVPNPQARLLRHLEGDESALPVTEGLNQQGVQRNLSIMQSWKLNVTPLTVYRSKTGAVKIVQGRAKDVPGLIDDIAAADPVQQ